MQIIKFSILILIFSISALIGKYLSLKYVYRLKELEEIKNALNIFKTKIKFTYSPLQEIFDEISKNTNDNVSKIFKLAKEKMNNKPAENSFVEAIDESQNNLKQIDKEKLKTLSKLLGTTDIDGQVAQIELTQSFIDEQIKEAIEEKNKNEKLYKQLGITCRIGNCNYFNIGG